MKYVMEMLQSRVGQRPVGKNVKTNGGVQESPFAPPNFPLELASVLQVFERGSLQAHRALVGSEPRVALQYTAVLDRDQERHLLTSPM